jgi:hypothetical protein
MALKYEKRAVGKNGIERITEFFFFRHILEISTGNNYLTLALVA